MVVLVTAVAVVLAGLDKMDLARVLVWVLLATAKVAWVVHPAFQDKPFIMLAADQDILEIMLEAQSDHLLNQVAAEMDLV